MNRIEYMLTEDDVVQFHLYYSATSKLEQEQRWKARIRGLVGYSGLVIVLALMKYVLLAYIAAFSGIAWFFLIPKTLQESYKKYYTRYVAEMDGDSLQQPMTIELRPDCIYATSYFGETKYWYTTVGKIVQNGPYTYIFLGRKMAFILPHNQIPVTAIQSMSAEIVQRKQNAIQGLDLEARADNKDA